MFGWFKKPRNLVWTDDVLIDARTDEVLAQVTYMSTLNAYRYWVWDGYWSNSNCSEAFHTKDGAKKFVEEKFR